MWPARAGKSRGRRRLRGVGGERHRWMPRVACGQRQTGRCSEPGPRRLPSQGWTAGGLRCVGAASTVHLQTHSAFPSPTPRAYGGPRSRAQRGGGEGPQRPSPRDEAQAGGRHLSRDLDSCQAPRWRRCRSGRASWSSPAMLCATGHRHAHPQDAERRPRRRRPAPSAAAAAAVNRPQRQRQSRPMSRASAPREGWSAPHTAQAPQPDGTGLALACHSGALDLGQDHVRCLNSACRMGSVVSLPHCDLHDRLVMVPPGPQEAARPAQAKRLLRGRMGCAWRAPHSSLRVGGGDAPRASPPPTPGAQAAPPTSPATSTASPLPEQRPTQTRVGVQDP